MLQKIKDSQRFNDVLKIRRHFDIEHNNPIILQTLHHMSGVPSFHVWLQKGLQFSK